MNSASGEIHYMDKSIGTPLNHRIQEFHSVPLPLVGLGPLVPVKGNPNVSA